MDRVKYERYLKTKKWKNLAKRVRQRANNRCQHCNTTGLLHVHHKTYERVGNERITDLIALCPACHEIEHISKTIPNSIETPEQPKKVRKLIIVEKEKEMNDSLFTLPFGKFKGQDIEDVPNSYLNWLLEQEWFENKYKKGYANTKKELEYRETYDINIEE